jgi:hypothetical protein
MNSKYKSLAEQLDDSLLRIQERKATVSDCLRSHPDAAADLQPLLETAVIIQNQIVPSDPSPEFLAASEIRLRKKLRAANPTGDRQAPIPSPLLRRNWIRAAAAILIVVGLFASGGGVATASARSLPGDPLYPVKRGFEQEWLAMSWTAAGDVSLLAQYSDERLGEVQALARAGREADLQMGLNDYEETLGLLDDALQRLPSNSDSALLDGIQTRLSRQADILSELLEQVPPAAQAELARAIDRSAQSRGLAQSLKLKKNPDNQLPGQEKKATNESGDSTPAKGKPTRIRETPDRQRGSDQPTKTPKTH